MKNSQYTKKQLKLINGEISLESVKGQTVSSLYRKALTNNDEEIAEREYHTKEINSS